MLSYRKTNEEEGKQVNARETVIKKLKKKFEVYSECLKRDSLNKYLRGISIVNFHGFR